MPRSKKKTITKPVLQGKIIKRREKNNKNFDANFLKYIAENKKPLNKSTKDELEWAYYAAKNIEKLKEKLEDLENGNKGYKKDFEDKLKENFPRSGRDGVTLKSIKQMLATYPAKDINSMFRRFNDTEKALDEDRKKEEEKEKKAREEEEKRKEITRKQIENSRIAFQNADTSSLENKYEVNRGSNYIDLTTAKFDLDKEEMRLIVTMGGEEKSFVYDGFLKKLHNIIHINAEDETDKLTAENKAALERERSFDWGRASENATSTSIGHTRISGLQELYETRRVLKQIYRKDNNEYITSSLYLQNDGADKTLEKYVYEFASGFDISLYPTKYVAKNAQFQRNSDAPTYYSLAKTLTDASSGYITSIMGQINLEINPKGITDVMLAESIKSSKILSDKDEGKKFLLKNDENFQDDGYASLSVEEKRNKWQARLRSFFTQAMLKEGKRLVSRGKPPKRDWLFSNKTVLPTIAEIAVLTELAEYQRAPLGHILGRLAWTVGGDDFWEIFTGKNPLFIGAKSTSKNIPAWALADEGGAEALRNISNKTASQQDKKNVFKLVSSLLINRYTKMTTTKGRGISVKDLDEFEDWMQQALRKSLGDVPLAVPFKEELLARGISTSFVENLWLSSRSAFLAKKENALAYSMWGQIFFKEWLPNNLWLLEADELNTSDPERNLEEVEEVSTEETEEYERLTGKRLASSESFSNPNNKRQRLEASGAIGYQEEGELSWPQVRAQQEKVEQARVQEIENTLKQAGLFPYKYEDKYYLEEPNGASSAALNDELSDRL